MVTLTVRKNRVGPVLGRHPWVFSQALLDVPDGLAPGTPVRLQDESGGYLASGYFNAYSQIAVRIWGHDPSEKIDRDFFSRRIRAALPIRRKYLESPGTDSYRLINGESDLLPGLIVDKYADCLVLQCHTKGIETWKGAVVDALMECLSPAGIYERSELGVRKKEGGGGTSGLLAGEVPGLVEIRENGLRFLVDIQGGQKTGFFLDQRDKRRAMMNYVKGEEVLNCFSYTGGFTVYALAGGARRTVSVDVSGRALELARENVKLNGFPLDNCDFIEADVKKYLRDKVLSEAFGVVVLDPPAFIKDRRKKSEGLRGYRGVNEAVLRAMPHAGGILFTCSCSAHLKLDEFRYMLSESAGRARRVCRILETYTHGIDHPELAAYTEGGYLKCLVVSVD
jgi:23S rRNA (cytosine1962-C5)-methyltransferase